MRRLRAVSTLLALALMLLAGPLATAQTPVVPPAYDPAALLAIRPDLREDVARSLPPGLTHYDIDVELRTDAPREHLRGTQQVTYTNTTGDPLDALPFRLYANSATPGNDAITIDEATIDGDPAAVTLSVDDSVATVALPKTLEPGAHITIEMAFAATIPTDASRHYGIYNLASEPGTWSLAHWYPVLAGRDPLDGWMLDPSSVYGDPIFTDAGLYDVRITVPDGMQVISSGVETGSTSANGSTTVGFNAWPSRDFVFVADTDMERVSRDVDGTTLVSWYEPGNGPAGEAALEWMAQSLTQFNDLLGSYPFAQLQGVEVEIPNAAGVEFPQLISLDAGYYRGSLDTSQPSHFEFTVVHEVVHQWFYNLVGNNQYQHAFIDEGLTNYLSARVYMDAHWPEEQADAVVARYLSRPFRNAVESNTDPIVDFPTDAFPTQRAYITAAYSKSPLGFGAIHEAMGGEAFFEALQAYVEDFRFRVATPEDLLAAFEATSDIDIEPIWSHWFRERNGALDIND